MPSLTAGQRPVTPGIPFPSTTQKHRAADWPIEDTAAAAYRLRALGADEDDALRVLDTLALRGVRNVRRYVAAAPDADVRAWIASASVELIHLEALRVSVRRAIRWPWRTSSGQERGVSHG